MRNLANNVWKHSSKFQSLLVLLLTATNGWNIMRQISVNLCLSIGMTMVILAGGIDLSVGSVLRSPVRSRRGSSSTRCPSRGLA